MNCFEEYLNTNVGGCPVSLVGMKANSYLTLRKGILNKTITDAECDFLPGFVIPVFVPGDLPYMPTSDGTMGKYLAKYDKKVEFFFVENTALSQVQIKQLEKESWVWIGRDNNGQTLVFGLEGGLKFVSASQELWSTDTHGGIMVTMQESQVNTPLLFGNDSLYDWIGL